MSTAVLMKRSPRVTSAAALASVMSASSPSVAQRVRYENEVTGRGGATAQPGSRCVVRQRGGRILRLVLRRGRLRGFGLGVRGIGFGLRGQFGLVGFVFRRFLEFAGDQEDP